LKFAAARIFEFIERPHQRTTAYFIVPKDVLAQARHGGINQAHWGLLGIKTPPEATIVDNRQLLEQLG